MSTRLRSWVFGFMVLVLLLTLSVVAGLALGRHLLREAGSIPVSTEPTEPGQPAVNGPADAMPPIAAAYRELWQARMVMPESVETLTALAQTTDGPGYHARLELARCVELPVEDRIGWYVRALDLLVDPAVRLELAEILASSGKKVQAVEAAAKVLPSPAAILVITSSAEPVPAARILAKAGLHSAALSVLEDVSGPEADLIRAHALLNTGRPAEAIPALERSNADRPGDTTVTLDLARAYERTGRTAEALNLYVSAGPAGLHEQGRLLARSGRMREAARVYIQSTDPEAQWKGALLLELEGAIREAMTVYDRISVSGSCVADDAAFRLWVLACRLGENTLAATTASRLPPGSHWQTHIGSEPAFEVSDHSPVVVPQGVVSAGLLLEEFGEGGRELGRIEVAIAAGRAVPEEKIACGEWYAAFGFYHEAARVGMSLLGQFPSEPVYRLAYPLAYRGEVLACARQFDVDPFLIWSVMREESHFHSSALSWMGACGLMQIMPATGEWIASTMGEAFTTARVMDPATNIRWGTWYLRHLLDRWDNDVDRALASYNGGQGSVSRWVSGPLYQDNLDLYAVIEFVETREYVTKVRNSLAVYRWLYGKGMEI